MTRPVSFVRAEPAVFIGLLQALAQAALGLVTAFGLDLTIEQAAAIHGFVAAILAVVGAIWTRGQVAPVAGLEALADAAPTPAQPTPLPVRKAVKPRR